jgi:hypothetical protein
MLGVLLIFLIVTIPVSWKTIDYVRKKYHHKVEEIYKLAPDELSYNVLNTNQLIGNGLYFTNKLHFDDYIKNNVRYLRISMLMFALLYVALYFFFK